MAKILFLSKNELFAEDIKNQLQIYATDFEVLTEDDDNAVLEVVIVDEMPEKIVELQRKMHKTPIILLLGQDDDFQGDDSVQVMNKPIKLEEFLDKIHAGINLFANSSDGMIVFNNYELNFGNKEIMNLRNGEVTKLTEREVSILKYLYKAQDKIVSKSQLLSEVWGYNPEATTHTVETHIYRLRQKVEHDDKSFQIIVTEDNGYKLSL